MLARMLQGVGVSPGAYPSHAAPPDGAASACVVDVHAFSSHVTGRAGYPLTRPARPPTTWDRHVACDGMTFLARFWAKVDKTGGPDACWPWCGARNGDGYGLIFIRRDGTRRIVRSAHRVAYALEHRTPIPDGLTLDHVCRNPRCVNPQHLEAVTNRENILRGTGWAARNVAVTHCPSGHAYDARNTYRKPSRSGRICRACNAVAARRRWARKRARESGGLAMPPGMS